MSPDQYRRINTNYLRAIEWYFDKIVSVKKIGLMFEQLILFPELTLDKINAHLGTSLSMEDLRSVYSGSLYKKRYHRMDYVTALGKYYIKKLLGDVVRFPRGNA